jgi:peptidoglycan-associated lipoprotein
MLHMTNSRRVSAALAALFFSFIAVGCHHTKPRPPATGGTTAAPTDDPYGAGAGTRSGGRDSSGGDIMPVDPNAGSVRDLPAGGDSGEGGPLADVRFELDSTALTAAAQQTLAAHASWLRDHRQRVTLEGHCDERGTVEYNLALGEQRAKAVYDHLVGLGVPAAQMQTSSLGKERPLDTAHTEEAFAKNRRVHFAVEG